MTVPKKYIHDRVILLLISINAYLTIAGVISVLFGLGDASSSTFTVQYRANLGLGAFVDGNATTFILFMFFMVFVMVFNTVLSIRVFHVRRGFSVALLAMATLLLVLTIVVSRSLLVNAR